MSLSPFPRRFSRGPARSASRGLCMAFVDDVATFVPKEHAKATRAARHTMGKRQKAKIKG
jgi:hypothetical protein